MDADSDRKLVVFENWLLASEKRPQGERNFPGNFSGSTILRIKIKQAEHFKEERK